MNHREWEATCGWLEACFKGELTDEQESAYARYFSGWDRDKVMAAIDRLVLDGEIFMPTPGQLVAAMLPLVPSFTEVWSEILPVLSHATDHGERGCIERIRERCGDLIAGWVASYGALRLAHEPMFDPDRAGFVENRLRQSWRDSTASHQQRELTATKVQRVLGGAQILRLPSAV